MSHLRALPVVPLAVVLAAVPLAGVIGACSSNSAPVPPPAPTADPEPAEGEGEGEGEAETIESNKPCLKAQAICEGGVCKADVKNECPEPVTCDFLIMALCEGSTERGEAKGKWRGTIPAGESDVMQAAADCEDATPAATTVESLTCR